MPPHDRDVGIARTNELKRGGQARHPGTTLWLAAVERTLPGELAPRPQLALFPSSQEPWRKNVPNVAFEA